MSEHGHEIRTCEFTNQFGERWTLIVRLNAGVGELMGDELDGESVMIRDDALPANLILGDDELAWLNESWEAAFGRRLRPSAAQRLIGALSALAANDVAGSASQK